MSGTQGYEMSEREIADIHNENTGNRYHRMNTIRARAFDAIYFATEKEFKLCPFKNRYGWCKLAEKHKGSHTVIWLGEDE